MGFIDLIRELRTGEPSLKKAAKVMKFLGWGCLFGGVWNFVLPQAASDKEPHFPLPASYPYLALIGFSITGALFLLSARGIQEMEPWGKMVGRAAIMLLMIGIFLFTAWIMPEFGRLSSNSGGFTFIYYFFFAIMLAQFGLPAYYGYRYLGRLPIKGDPYSAINYNPMEITRSLSERMNEGATKQQVEMKYKDSPFPFGIMGTFPLLIAVPLLGMFVGEKYAGPAAMAIVFPLVFMLIFLGPAVFNYLSSPFQQNRRLVATFTGGGSIYLFHGSWPFFRLMVYDDALEIRVMFHRFLIPYEEMEDIPSKIGFFRTGLLIKSDLPNVPSSIRFGGFGMKKIVQIVSEARNAWRNMREKPPNPQN